MASLLALSREWDCEAPDSPPKLSSTAMGGCEEAGTVLFEGGEDGLAACFSEEENEKRELFLMRL